MLLPLSRAMFSHMALPKTPSLRLPLHTALPLVVVLALWTLFLLHITTPYTLPPVTQVEVDPDEHVRPRLLSDLPHCARMGRASTFLLVFMGHSGSTALITSLQQHSQTAISSLEPVDHGSYMHGPANETAAKALNYTKELFMNGTRMNKTVGFKIRPRHLLVRPEEFNILMAKFNTRIIWNFRSNVFKQAIGDYSIKVRGDMSAHEGLKLDKNGTAVRKSPEGRVRIHNMTFLHQLLKSRIAGDRQVTKALHLIRPDGCVLPMSYESYLRRPELSVQRLQAFLGLNMDEVHPPLRAKANKDSTCDLVENWEEICERFFGCLEWRWMLDDFDNGCSCSSLHPSRFDASRKFCALS